ncbi:MAG: L-threonine 3-dehydrogenase [Gammaproteobacteria bacterium]|nr:L-threonine 3-dehydrogenase [Gammaproteobacteria bacterium]MCH9715624.1 L-threonine 3-dehydrogenase [Gammaproteobacteria bacterium]MCH9763320.1 L-threonine 3-dehydrogenase [Gammaproteobacteria bacterium]
MKALVKARPEPGIWMEDVPMPTCGAHEVLVKIKKTAICGTDIHIYSWDDWARQVIDVPLVIGHEFFGKIVELGPEVKNLKIGQRVSGEGHLVCGTCRNCRTERQHLCPNTQGVGVNRQGCFAEYLALPASNIVALSDDIKSDYAAILDPFGNAAHCALSFNLVGEDVLITGAGPVGLMAVAIAKHAGARHVVITDVSDYRLKLARKMGATHALNVTNNDLKTVMKTLGISEGFQVGLEMSGNAMALNQMLDAMSYGGQLALLGILPKETVIDWNQVIFKGLIMKGIYGREMYDTWYKMLSMLQSGLDLSPVITHHFSVDDFQKAFQVMASGQSGKIILDWN